MTNQNTEDLLCDTCGIITDNPWHSSRLNNRHYHECDLCHDKETMNNTKMNINLLEQECTINDFTQPWPLLDTQKMCSIIVDKCVELCKDENSKVSILEYFKETK